MFVSCIHMYVMMVALSKITLKDIFSKLDMLRVQYTYAMIPLTLTQSIKHMMFTL